MLFGLLIVSTAVIAPAADASAAPPALSASAVQVGANGVRISWTVSGGDSSNLLYVYSDDVNHGGTDPGFAPQVCAPTPNGCSKTVHVPTGGTYRYTVSLRNDALEYTNRTVEITVPGLEPPVVGSDDVLTHVDQFDVADQTFSWSRSGTGYVQITPPGSWFPLAETFPASGSYPVPASDLSVGRSVYLLEYCEGSGANKFCSEPSEAGFIVGAARFDGDERRFVDTGEELSITWSASGTGWFVSDPKLEAAVWTTTPAWTFPASASPGLHQVTLASCVETPSSRCSNADLIAAQVEGVVTFSAAADTGVYAGQVLGTVTPLGGSPTTLTAPRAGTIMPLVANGSTQPLNTEVAVVSVDAVDRIQIVVGEEGTVDWTTRTWSDDFIAKTEDLKERRTVGSALDVAFDAQGGLWAIGEFGSAVAYQSGSTYTHRLEPLVRTGTLAPTKPYETEFGNPPSPAPFSDLAEKVVTARNAVWFTHGGTAFNGGPGNHSRIVRVARGAADSTSTLYDDGMCAIHVPGANNGVIGATHDATRNRLWFAAPETGGAGGTAEPSLYWFWDSGQASALSDPRFVGCDNTLDYSNAAAVSAASTANLCSATVTTKCMTRIKLPAAGGYPAHIELDTSGTSSGADDSIWWVDFTGGVLGKYGIGSGTFTCFSLPTSDFARSYFRGFPWQLRVSGDYVYIGEYGDNDLVRFNKVAGGPSSDCVTAPPSTPAMSELHIPLATEDVNLHSIEVDGDKLWFTLANEAGVPLARDASTFGYVSISSWNAGTPTGVIYEGLDTLGELTGARRHSFRGIDVLATTGEVGLADMHGNALIRLTPI